MAGLVQARPSYPRLACRTIDVDAGTSLPPDLTEGPGMTAQRSAHWQARPIFKNLRRSRKKESRHEKGHYWKATIADLKLVRGFWARAGSAFSDDSHLPTRC